MPAKDVKAYVKRNKNDAIDAAACCEAVRRTTVRTVPIKTPDQQASLMQHRVRDLLVRQRTQTINALRGHMAELGIVAAKGYEGLKKLILISKPQLRKTVLTQSWYWRRGVQVLQANLVGWRRIHSE